MLITITEFAEERNEDRDTVNAYIRNHPEIKKYVTKQGKNTVIDTDSEGFRLLEKQYPLPQMVQVIEDTESRKQLIEAQKIIIQMQNKMLALQEKIAESEVKQILLEDKTARLEAAEKQLEEKEAKLEQKDLKLEKKEAELSELRTELERERSKTWFDKLRGR